MCAVAYLDAAARAMRRHTQGVPTVTVPTPLVRGSAPRRGNAGDFHVSCHNTAVSRHKGQLAPATRTYHVWQITKHVAAKGVLVHRLQAAGARAQAAKCLLEARHHGPTEALARVIVLDDARAAATHGDDESR